MENFNEYRDNVDFSSFIDYALEHGKLIRLKKKEYLGYEGTNAQYAGYIKSGAVRYTCLDREGKEHIVGYSFDCDFACDYPSFLHKAPRQVSIQAIKNSEIYLLTYEQLQQYIDETENGLHIFLEVTQEYAATIYKRLLSFYRDSPEIRYLDLVQRCPNLTKVIPLKEIASFVGVTPETLSHIRKKLKEEGVDPDHL